MGGSEPASIFYTQSLIVVEFFSSFKGSVQGRTISILKTFPKFSIHQAVRGKID